MIAPNFFDFNVSKSGSFETNLREKHTGCKVKFRNKTVSRRQAANFRAFQLQEISWLVQEETKPSLKKITRKTAHAASKIMESADKFLFDSVTIFRFVWLNFPYMS